MAGISNNFDIGKMQAAAAQQDTSALTRAASAASDPSNASDRAEIKKVADEFESLFLNMVLKSMRETVQKSGLVDGGNAEDIYRGMLDDEYSKLMATQRSTGIADQIESFMLTARGLKDPKDALKTPPEAPAPAAPAAKSAALKAYGDAALQVAPKRETMKDATRSSAPSPSVPSRSTLAP